MSACASPLSSNRRIEPAVALKDNVRPGSSSVCLVVESGGSRCDSAATGEAGGLPLRAPGPPFCADGDDGAGAGCAGCGKSSARAPAASIIIRIANTKPASRSAAMAVSPLIARSIVTTRAVPGAVLDSRFSGLQLLESRSKGDQHNAWGPRSLADLSGRLSTTLAESFCAEVLHEYVSDNVGTV